MITSSGASVSSDPPWALWFGGGRQDRSVPRTPDSSLSEQLTDQKHMVRFTPNVPRFARRASRYGKLMPLALGVIPDLTLLTEAGSALIAQDGTCLSRGNPGVCWQRGYGTGTRGDTGCTMRRHLRRRGIGPVIRWENAQATTRDYLSHA